MALYQGVLQGFSGGTVISTAPTGYRETAFGNVVASGRRAYAGMTRREFIDIGDQHLRNVMLTPYQDELLQESVGEEIALSIVGGRVGVRRVVAIRTPKRGVDKVGFGVVLGSSIRNVVVFWIFAVIFCLLFLISFAQILGFINDMLGMIAVIADVGFFFFLLGFPFYLNWQYYHAWKAIPAGSSPGMAVSSSG